MQFVSEARHEIRGRGTLYMVRAPFAFARDSEYRQFLGEHLIDGVVREVVGLESEALGTIAAGKLIGLLVA